MKGIRIGICAVVVFTVLAHGAVEPWSEAILEASAALLLIWWAILFSRRAAPDLRWNLILAPLAGLYAFAVFQYLTHLTAVPFLTKIEILKFSALGILVFLFVQAYRTLEDYQGFIWFLLSLCFLVSVLGILQHFTFNGKLYWFRELRYGGIPFGPYVNRNHFAGFVELVVPSGLAFLFLRAHDRDRLSLLAVLTLLPIGALFLAASRGGIVSFCVEGALILVAALIRGSSGNRLVPVAVLVVLGVGLVAWLGVGPTLARFSTYRRLEVTESRRIEMRQDTWHIFLDHPILGTGLGTLQEVFPRYETLDDGTIVDHAHNDYVEGLAETGMIGALFGAFFLGVLFTEGWLRFKGAENPPDLALHVGSLAACTGLLVHSLVDFNLHIPSNALLFLLQAVVATSLMPSFSSAYRHTGKNLY